MRVSHLAASVALCVATACGGDDDAGTDGGLDGSTEPPDARTVDAGRRDSGPRPDSGPLMPNPRLTGLGDNTVMDLGEVDCGSPSNPADFDCRSITDYSGMAYDSSRNQMLAWGGGHATTMADSIQALDVGGSLTWRDLYPTTQCDEMTMANFDEALGAWASGVAGPYPRPMSAHSYDLVVYGPVQDELILIGRAFTGGNCSFSNDIGGPVAHYGMERGTWEFSSEPRDMSGGLPGSDYDPVSGYFIALGQEEGLVVYDPATRQRVATLSDGQTSSGGSFSLGDLSYANNLTYAPTTDRFYYMDGSRVWEIELDRASWSSFTIDELTVTGPGPSGAEVGYAYDTVNGIIGGGIVDDVFHAFDPVAHAWTELTVTGGTPGTMAFHMIGYSPVDNVFIFRTTYESGRNAWAYRYRN